MFNWLVIRVNVENDPQLLKHQISAQFFGKLTELTDSSFCVVAILNGVEFKPVVDLPESH